MSMNYETKAANIWAQIWDKHLLQIAELEREATSARTIKFMGREVLADMWGLEEPTSARIKVAELVGLTRVEKEMTVFFRRGFNSPTIQSLATEAWESWEARRAASMAAARAAIEEVADKLASSPHFKDMLREMGELRLLNVELRDRLLGLNKKFRAE